MSSKLNTTLFLALKTISIWFRRLKWFTRFLSVHGENFWNTESEWDGFWDSVTRGSENRDSTSRWAFVIRQLFRSRRNGRWRGFFADRTAAPGTGSAFRRRRYPWSWKRVAAAVENNKRLLMQFTMFEEGWGSKVLSFSRYVKQTNTLLKDI